jgi:signal transduction histidine kinase
LQGGDDVTNAGAVTVARNLDLLTLSVPEPGLWDRFDAGRIAPQDFEQHAVLARWDRARRLMRKARPWPPLVAPDELCARQQAAGFVVRTFEALDAALGHLRSRGFASVVADHEGVIVTSRGIDLFGDQSVRAGLLPGVRLSEADFGTNAAGTALAEHRPVAVLGSAHYEWEAKQATCYSAPIRNTSGRTVAVLALTGPADAADPLVGTVALSLGMAIESALRFHELTELLVAAPEGDRSQLFAAGQLQIGMLSHDLRNPLHAISVGADLLVRHGDPLVTRVASRVSSSAARMQRMVDELLDFTRGSAGTVSLDRRPTDLSELCRKVLDDLRIVHPDRPLTLDCSADTRGRWDADRLTRVIENLVGNAIAYGQPGTPVAVTVSAHIETVTLEVTNEGPPIPRALRSHIFDPFHRGSSEGSGLGLGLHIARSIVLAHGGIITLHSDDGLTRFCVRLPRDLG